VQRSTLPVYHPLLRELLTTEVSRRTKPVKKSSLIHPPKLPERAIHRDSEEARLVGPFSKRREVNIRWRFFSEEIRKIYPPVEVYQEDLEEKPQGTHNFAGYGFQEGMVKHIEELSGLNRSPTIPRREKQGLTALQSLRDRSLSDGHEAQHERSNVAPLPTRWLRRRYRELLHTVPLVSQRLGKGKKLGYSVQLSPNALGGHTQTTIARIGRAKPTDLEWIEKSSVLSSRK